MIKQLDIKNRITLWEHKFVEEEAKAIYDVVSLTKLTKISFKSKKY